MSEPTDPVARTWTNGHSDPSNGRVTATRSAHVTPHVGPAAVVETAIYNMSGDRVGGFVESTLKASADRLTSTGFRPSGTEPAAAAYRAFPTAAAAVNRQPTMTPAPRPPAPRGPAKTLRPPARRPR